jgi:hypothetical protein
MKNIFLLSLLFLYFPLLGQTTKDSSATSPVKFKGKFSFYSFKPIAFGDNFISKGHSDNTIGLGFEIQVITIYNFGISGGGNFSQFDVTDKALAGNATKTNATSFYGKVSYDFTVKNNFEISPFFGVGSAIYSQKEDKFKFGTQRGTSFYIGTNFAYKLNKTISFFIGAEYQFNKMNTVTNEEFDDFFNKINQANIRLGLILQ